MAPLLSETLDGFPKLLHKPEPPPIAFFVLGSRELDWLWLKCPENMRTYVVSEFNRLLAPNQLRQSPISKAPKSEWQAEAHRLLGRCPLFYSLQMLDPAGDTRSTYNFKPHFTLDQITAHIQELFTDKLEKVIKKNPKISFHDDDGIMLSQECVVHDYYRCDALVDSVIADELAEELANIAHGFAAETPEGKIDYVISCTSPTHWFVHKIVDGLGEYGIPVGHYVFAAKSSIKTEIENTGIHKGHNVVLFTDVISSGNLIETIAKYVEKTEAHLVGLIAIIDTRDLDELENSDPIKAKFDGKVQILVRLPVAMKNDRIALQKAKWIKHGDTAALRLRKLSGDREREDYYNLQVFGGIGRLKEHHGFWSDPTTLLRHLAATKALRAGHFKHGSHHSIIYCDVRQAFSDAFLREAFVTTLFQYIIINNIDLVVCPNDSGIYLIKDELALRFPKESVCDVMFVTASRISTPEHSYVYILTTLNSEFKGVWPQSIRNVLIMDDGIVSGETMRSLVSEVIGDSRKVTADTKKRTVRIRTQTSEQLLPLESIHIATFISRLADGQSEFFCNLEEFTRELKKTPNGTHEQSDPIVFSALFSLPIKAYPEDACPVCRRFDAILGIAGNEDFLSTIRNFCSEWYHNLKVLNPHEIVSLKEDSGVVVCGEEA